MGRKRTKSGKIRLTEVAKLAGVSPITASRYFRNPDALSLSKRERDVLRCLAGGKTGYETASTLGISVCTVRVHIRSIRRKLHATNIPHAVAIAWSSGLLRSDSSDS